MNSSVPGELYYHELVHPEPPRGTNDYCPRKNGIFSHPDETVCDVFFTCVDGEYIEAKCQGGLHFDEYSGTCIWPDNANRENCQESKKELKDGFVCPKDQNKNDRTGQVIAHPHYAHPTDCQKVSCLGRMRWIKFRISNCFQFYVCLNGIEPRELQCDQGEVFSEDTKKCDDPETVPGCEDWFEAAISE